MSALERLLLYAALGVGAGLAVIPLWYMVTVALQPKIFILEAPSSLWPRAITFDNFVKAWSENDFQRYFLNSLVVAIAIAVRPAAPATRNASSVPPTLDSQPARRPPNGPDPVKAKK